MSNNNNDYIGQMGNFTPPEMDGGEVPVKKLLTALDRRQILYDMQVRRIERINERLKENN